MLRTLAAFVDFLAVLRRFHGTPQGGESTSPPHFQQFGSIIMNTIKYYVTCTNGKISVKINLLFYLFFNVVPSNICVFHSCRPFIVNTTFLTGLVGVEVSSVSTAQARRQKKLQHPQDLLKMLY